MGDATTISVQEGIGWSTTRRNFGYSFAREAHVGHPPFETYSVVFQSQLAVETKFPYPNRWDKQQHSKKSGINNLDQDITPNLFEKKTIQPELQGKSDRSDCKHSPI